MKQFAKYFTLSLTLSLQFATAGEPTETEANTKLSVRAILETYKKAEATYTKSNGDLSRTLGLLLPQASTADDEKFLSNALGMYGLTPSHSIKTKGTQLILSEKSNTYVIELEKIYDKEIKINNDIVKINVDFDFGSLEQNYTRIENDLKAYLKNKKEKEKTLVSYFINLLLPKAEAFGGYLNYFFKGSGAALTGATQRNYGGLKINMDPNSRYGSGHSGPLPAPSGIPNYHFFHNYHAPASFQQMSGGSAYNRGPAPVYQKPGGGRIQTWNAPAPGWVKVN